MDHKRGVRMRGYLLVVGVLLAIIVGMGYFTFVGGGRVTYFDPVEVLPIPEERSDDYAMQN